MRIHGGLWLIASLWICFQSGSAGDVQAQRAPIYPAGRAVAVVVSTHDRSELMAPQPSVKFTQNSGDAGTNTVVVDATQRYQSIDGFGAAFTDSACYLLHNVAQKKALAAAMSNLFTRTGSGIGLSFMRNPIGASDLARSVYSFDDQPVGTTDDSLSGFSIAHDQSYIIPIIRQAKALNPQMKIVAAPWSPPGWMKDPASMHPVSLLGGSLLMTSSNEAAFAKYFVKYIEAYQAAGVPIDFIALQNEPQYVSKSYPTMGMTDTEQLELLKKAVLPALTAAGLSTKVMVFDHNWNSPSYPETVLAGLTEEEKKQVIGTAWHGYEGEPGAQQAVQEMFPSMGGWMTELSGGTWVSDQFTSDFLGITLVLRNSAKAYVKWSLALDEKMGPNLTQNAGLGGCNTCSPLVTVNSTTGAISYDTEYYTLGHYSRYVLPGAVRIYSSNTPAIASVAFLNPDETTALIVYNNASSSQQFQVQWGQQSFPYTLPAQSAATFTWTGSQIGKPAIAAIAQIQGSSYSSESGLGTENTSDLSGAYDLGFLTSGSHARYDYVDFGAAGSVHSVSVRAASAGEGGSATFYLDSMDSTPIATVNLPVTGGWQSWQTQTASVRAVFGVHTLYVVFRGGGATGKIANVNWFQFQ